MLSGLDFGVVVFITSWIQSASSGEVRSDRAEAENNKWRILSGGGLCRPFKKACSPREGTRPTRFLRKSACSVGPVPSPGGFFNRLLALSMQSEAPLTLIRSPLRAGYLFSVFAECPPLPARDERGEGRGGGKPGLTGRWSLLSPALSSGSGGEGEENKAPLNRHKAGRGELECPLLGSLFGDPDTVPTRAPLSLSKRERVTCLPRRLPACHDGADRRRRQGVRVRLDCTDTA